MRKLILIILVFTLAVPQPTYALRPSSARNHARPILSLSLNELTDLILEESKKGKYELLSLNWSDMIYEYQAFIKHLAAINTAIKSCLRYESSGLREFKSPRDFLEKAIEIRIDMLNHYNVPLTTRGKQEIERIEHTTEKSRVSISTLCAVLREIMDPPQSWFIKFFDRENRPKVKKPIKVVATWGCSTQCDHCDGGPLIQIMSFPWCWLKQVEQNSWKPKLCNLKNDYFRDYYDFIYDIDASHVIELFFDSPFNTSGFEKGTVAERALRRLLERYESKNRKLDVNISLAHSPWMRRIGPSRYLECILNIKKLVKKYKNYISFKIYLFKRKNDPFWLKDVIRHHIDSETCSEPGIVGCGRFAELKQDMDLMAEAVLLGGNFYKDEIGKSFFLPDGQLVEGVEPSTDYPEFKTVFGPIARNTIKCWHCGINCKGEHGIDCPGRAAIFRRWGLSETGGYPENLIKPLGDNIASMLAFSAAA